MEVPRQSTSPLVGEIVQKLQHLGNLTIAKAIRALYFSVTIQYNKPIFAMKAHLELHSTPSVGATIIRISLLGCIALGTSYVLLMALGMITRAV